MCFDVTLHPMPDEGNLITESKKEARIERDVVRELLDSNIKLRQQLIQLEKELSAKIYSIAV